MVTALLNSKVSMEENINPHARDMMALAEKYFQENRFIDVAYSTPNYLKEYQTTIPKNRVLNK